MGADVRAVAYLGLGSNQGKRRAHLQAAAAALERAGVEVRRVSSLYEGAFVGCGSPQPTYLNAVLEVTTALSPLGLLACTQAIEREHGRRPDSHLQPRPLDIDVLFYGDGIVRHPALVLPHPRMAERRFVLEPLAELGALASGTRRALARRLPALRAEQSLRRLGTLHGEERRETIAV